MPPPRILVTGPPGIGKTTLVRHVLELLRGKHLAGFYTEEVRGRTGRTGFRIVTLDGRTARLATAGGTGGPRVGRYSVHLAALEAVCADALEPRAGVDALVIDEIGKMECLSPAFVGAARRALSGPLPVLGTVARAGGGFIGEAKRLPGVEVVALSRENRERLPAEIATRLGGGGGGGRHEDGAGRSGDPPPLPPLGGARGLGRGGPTAVGVGVEVAVAVGVVPRLRARFAGATLGMSGLWGRVKLVGHTPPAVVP